MTITQKRSALPVLAAFGAAALVAAPAALACDDHLEISADSITRVISGPNNRVVYAAVGDPVVAIQSFIGDDSTASHSVQVHVDDGVLSVTLDGEEIDTHRLSLKDGRIFILHPDGSERALEGVFIGGDHDKRFGSLFNLDNFNNFRFETPQTTWESPKVMIGINMSEPDEALRHHLGLEAGTTTMISALYKGFPAEEAGLEQYDIIIAVDGDRPADAESVHGALKNKEAGDDLILEVIQRGKTRRIVVELTAFDESKWREAGMGGGAVIFGPGADGPRIRWGTPGTDWPNIMVDPQGQHLFRWDRDRLRELNERLEGLGDLKKNRNADDAETQERLERLNERLEKMQRMLDELVDQSRELRDDR